MVEPRAQQTKQPRGPTDGARRAVGAVEPRASEADAGSVAGTAADASVQDAEASSADDAAGAVLLPGEARPSGASTTPVYGRLMAAALRSSPGASACVGKDGRPSRS
jgi:hypothetical protein